MKFKSFFATALVGLAVSSLTSCSQDDVVSPEMGGVSGFKSGNYVSVSLKPDFSQLKRTRGEGESIMEEPGTGIFNPFSGKFRVDIFIYKDSTIEVSENKYTTEMNIVIKDSVIFNELIQPDALNFNYILKRGKKYKLFALFQKLDNTIGTDTKSYQLYNDSTIINYKDSVGFFDKCVKRFYPCITYATAKSEFNANAIKYDKSPLKGLFVNGKCGDAYYAQASFEVPRYSTSSATKTIEFKRFLNFIRVASDKDEDINSTISFGGKYTDRGECSLLPYGVKYDWINFQTIWGSNDGDEWILSKNNYDSYEFDYNGKHYKSMMNAFLFPALLYKTKVPILPYMFTIKAPNMSKGCVIWESPNSLNTATVIIPDVEIGSFTSANMNINATVLSGFN